MQRYLSLLLAWLIAFQSTPALSLDVNGELKRAYLERLSSDPAVGAESKIYWNSTDKKAKVHDGTSWAELGSGSGSGGLDSAVDNGNAEDASTTMLTTYDDGAVAVPLDGTDGSPSFATGVRTTTSAQLISGTGTWKLSKSAGDGTGEGWAFSFTTPTNSRLHQSFVALNLAYYFSTATVDDVRVYVYDVTNAAVITPSFNSCGGGSTPSVTKMASTCNAQLGFAAADGVSYRVLIHIADNGSSSGAWDLYVDDIYVGVDGGVAVGTQVGEPTSYTPTISGVGTATSVGITSARTASRIRITGQFTTGTVAGSEARLTLPNSWTIATPGAATEIVGKWWTSISTATTAKHGSIQAANGSAYVTFGSDDYTNSQNPITALNGSDLWSSTTVVWVSFEVEVSQLVGGSSFGENKIEYAYNTAGTTTAGATAAATTTAYGPGGVAIGSIASTTSDDDTSFSVRFRTPIQHTDRLILQVNDGRTGWVDASQYFPRLFQSTSRYGMRLDSLATTTDVLVRFGNRGAYPSNGTYAGTGDAWSTYGSYKWRVVKIAGGLAVPFGLATADTSGLISTEAQTLAGDKTFTGQVIASTPAATHAYRNSALTATADTTVSVIFDATLFNVGTQYSTSTGRFTATNAGYYQVSYGLRVDTGGTPPTALIGSIQKNDLGTLVTIAVNRQTDLVASKSYHLSDTAVVRLEAGETVRVTIHSAGQDSTVDYGTAGQSVLSVTYEGS